MKDQHLKWEIEQDMGFMTDTKVSKIIKLRAYRNALCFSVENEQEKIKMIDQMIKDEEND